MSEEAKRPANVLSFRPRRYQVEWIEPQPGPMPSSAQTVDDWRCLLFQQIRLDPKWIDVAQIDFLAIEDIIRRIATYGVRDEQPAPPHKSRQEPPPMHSQTAIVIQAVAKLPEVSRAWFEWNVEPDGKSRTLVVEVNFDTDPSSSNYNPGAMDDIAACIQETLAKKTTMIISWMRVVPAAIYAQRGVPTDNHVFVVCRDGTFYELVPEEVRHQGPWQGMHRGEIERLKPEYRLALARDGYALVKCEL